MREVNAELLAELPGVHLDRDICPITMQPGPRFRFRSGLVECLDSGFKQTATRHLEMPSTVRILAASPDLSVVVAADDDSVYLNTREFHQLPVSGADSATLLPHGEVLVTAARVKRTTFQGGSDLSNGGHRVLLVSAQGEVVAEAVLDVYEGEVSAMPHPRDGSVVLDAGEGQNGSRIFVVRSVRGRLEVEALLDDVVAACFDAAGDRLLLTPYPSFENRARVVNWPSLDELASFNGEVDRLYGRLDLYGCFLRADSVLLSRVEQPPIVCDSNLVPVALVQLGASSLGPNAQAETVVGLSPNAFGAQLWAEDASSATAWRLPFDGMTYR